MARIQAIPRSTSFLDSRYVNISGDTMTGKLTISVATTTTQAIQLKTTDDNTTKNLLEILKSTEAVLAYITATGEIVGAYNAGISIYSDNLARSMNVINTPGTDSSYVRIGNATDNFELKAATFDIYSGSVKALSFNGGVSALDVNPAGSGSPPGNSFFQVRGSSTGTYLAYFYANGRNSVNFGKDDTTLGNNVVIHNLTAANVAFQVVGAASQSGHLQTYQNSSRTVLALVDKDGAFVFNETGLDADSRIEGDNDDNAFYLDASADAVGIGTNAPATKLEIAQTKTITGATADGYSAALTLDPEYTASSAQTVTRHNYLDINDPGVTNVTITDAAVMRFDAAAGTHKATVGATTKTTPSAVDAWLKININSTIYYVPAYTSTTS